MAVERDECDYDFFGQETRVREREREGWEGGWREKRSCKFRDVNFNLGEDSTVEAVGAVVVSYVIRTRPFATLTTFLLVGCGSIRPSIPRSRRDYGVAAAAYYIFQVKWQFEFSRSRRDCNSRTFRRLEVYILRSIPAPEGRSTRM